eukprot:scaffold46338_cov64-Phaeocystis_antarctica.AAC.4
MRLLWNQSTPRSYSTSQRCAPPLRLRGRGRSPNGRSMYIAENKDTTRYMASARLRHNSAAPVSSALATGALHIAAA